MIKRIILIALFLMPIFNIAKGATVIRLAQFQDQPILIKILNQNVREIEKKHPGLKIVVQTFPYLSFQEKILTQIAAGNPPDILFVEINNIVDLAGKGVFEDLMPYAKQDRLDLKGYYPAILNRFKHDGKLYAIPNDISPQGIIYYNKKLFKQAGVPFPKDDWTWPEPFLSICQKLVQKDKNGNIDRWAYLEFNPVNADNFLLSNGACWVDDVDHPTRMTLDTPEALQALRFRWDLIHTYQVSPSVASIMSFSGGAANMFQTGRVAMLTAGQWYIPQFDRAGLDYDFVMFPKGPKGKRRMTCGGTGYGLVSAGKNKDLAWEVLKGLSSEESVRRVCSTGTIQPALIKVAESKDFLKAPGPKNKKTVLSMPPYCVYSPYMDNWSEISWGIMLPASDAVWSGKKKPEEVFPELTKRINAKFFKK